MPRYPPRRPHGGDFTGLRMRTSRPLRPYTSVMMQEPVFMTSFADEFSLAILLIIGMICLPMILLLVVFLHRIRTRSMERILRRMDDREHKGETSDPRDPWVESGRRLGRAEAQGLRPPQPGEDTD